MINLFITESCWGVYIGLKTCRCWDNGWKRAMAETDSLLAFQMITQASIYRMPKLHSSLSTAIRNLNEQNWTVTLNHVYRECNSVADWLSKYASTLNLRWRKTPTGSRTSGLALAEQRQILNYYIYGFLW